MALCQDDGRAHSATSAALSTSTATPGPAPARRSRNRVLCTMAPRSGPRSSKGATSNLPLESLAPAKLRWTGELSHLVASSSQRSTELPACQRSYSSVGAADPDNSSASTSPATAASSTRRAVTSSALPMSLAARRSSLVPRPPACSRLAGTAPQASQMAITSFTSARAACAAAASSWSWSMALVSSSGGPRLNKGKGRPWRRAKPTSRGMTAVA